MTQYEDIVGLLERATEALKEPDYTRGDSLSLEFVNMAAELAAALRAERAARAADVARLERELEKMRGVRQWLLEGAERQDARAEQSCADLADAQKQIAAFRLSLAEARADAFAQAVAECDDEAKRIPDEYHRASFQAGACRCAWRLRRLAKWTDSEDAT